MWGTIESVAPPGATLWVSIRTDDGQTFHVRTETGEETDRLCEALVGEFGTEIVGSLRIEWLPLTWECDGRDGCTQTA